MGRDRGMGRKGEKRSRNISELHLKHRLIWCCTQAKSVLTCEQRSPSWVEGCWDLYVAPQTTLQPYLYRVAICARRVAWRMHWLFQIQSPLGFTPHLRTEKGWKQNITVWDREGKGQRKEKQPSWKSEIVISQWNRGIITQILSHFSWFKCT